MSGKYRVYIFTGYIYPVQFWIFFQSMNMKNYQKKYSKANIKSFQSNGVCIIYESVIACVHIFLKKNVMVGVVNLAEYRITRQT